MLVTKIIEDYSWDWRSYDTAVDMKYRLLRLDEKDLSLRPPGTQLRSFLLMLVVDEMILARFERVVTA
jgi:hypothetical protein